MQYSDVTGGQGLIQDISFLTNVDINKYPLKDRARNINEWNRVVWTWIFEAYGGWQFDDDNNSSTTDLPNGSVDFVAEIGEYGIPSGALTIRKIEILQSDGSTSVELLPLPIEGIPGAEASFLSTSGTPRYYRLVGDVVKLYPTPNYSGVKYLTFFFDRDMLAFAFDDTTEVPGFASPFHRTLSIGASLDYSIAKGPATKVNSFSGLIADYKKRLQKFYAKRFLANYPTSIKVGDSTRMYS